MEALRGPQTHIIDIVEKLRKRRDYIVKRLNAIEGISCRIPHGAFYVFPKVNLDRYWEDDQQFVLDLLSKTGTHSAGIGIRQKPSARAILG